MKKVTFLCILIVLLISGCSKVSYSSEFIGMPIYPGTELIMNNEFDNRVSETYFGMYTNGDIEKVRHFFEKNIDTSIWTVEKVDKPLVGQNAEKVYGYSLKSKDRNADLTLAYLSKENVLALLLLEMTWSSVIH